MCIPSPRVLITTTRSIFLLAKREKKKKIVIQHHYLVPPPVHPLTYQVRPFTVLLLHMGTLTKTKKRRKKRKLGGRGVTFLCMQKCEIIFFLSIEEKNGGKKETGAVGMKVNNMHEFVKKINNAAFCWLGFFFFVC